jgi:hypothetical protein
MRSPACAASAAFEDAVHAEMLFLHYLIRALTRAVLFQMRDLTL